MVVACLRRESSAPLSVADALTLTKPQLPHVAFLPLHTSTTFVEYDNLSILYTYTESGKYRDGWPDAQLSNFLGGSDTFVQTQLHRVSQLLVLAQ